VLVPYKTRRRLKENEKNPPFFAGRGYFNTFEGIPCSSPLNGSERRGEKGNSSSVKDGWSQESNIDLLRRSSPGEIIQEKRTSR
jgi:hypothetical protein